MDSIILCVPAQSKVRNLEYKNLEREVFRLNQELMKYKVLASFYKKRLGLLGDTEWLSQFDYLDREEPDSIYSADDEEN